MPLLQMEMIITIDGRSVRGFPRTFLFDVDEVQEFDYDEAADNNDTTFSQLPVTEIDTVQALFVQAVSAIGLRLEGGESGNAAVRLGAGGGIVIWGGLLTDTNITVNVNAATAARIRGTACGT